VNYIYVDMHDSDIGGYVADAQRALAQKVQIPRGYRLESSFAITPLNCRVGGERSFADVGANGEVAPIPAVRGSEIRLLDSRDASTAWDLRRAD
jgi:hypothetical protein